MDERKRQIEREVAQGGSEAGSRLLRERIRSGEISNHHARMASILGDQRAALLFPESESIDPEPLKTWKKWIENQDDEFVMRVSLVLANLLLGERSNRLDMDNQKQTLNLIAKCVLEPSDQNRDNLEEFLDGWIDPDQRAEGLEHHVNSVLVLLDYSDFKGTLLKNFFANIEYRIQRQEMTSRGLKDSIKTFLIPWLLGEGDFLKDWTETKK